MIVNKQLAESKGVDQKDLWETPAHIFKLLNDEFHFTLDPCCTKETQKCAWGLTPKQNGLSVSWEGQRVFVNPPYSKNNIDLWAEKCFIESRKENTSVVALLPVSTSAKWWHNWIIGKAELRFVERRIRFIGAPYTAPFSSVIAIFNKTGIRSFKQQELDYPIMPHENDNIINCPSCGKEWNLSIHNACECGALLKENIT